MRRRRRALLLLSMLTMFFKSLKKKNDEKSKKKKQQKNRKSATVHFYFLASQKRRNMTAMLTDANFECVPCFCFFLWVLGVVLFFFCCSFVHGKCCKPSVCKPHFYNGSSFLRLLSWRHDDIWQGDIFTIKPFCLQLAPAVSSRRPLRTGPSTPHFSS